MALQLLELRELTPKEREALGMAVKKVARRAGRKAVKVKQRKKDAERASGDERKRLPALNATLPETANPSEGFPPAGAVGTGAVIRRLAVAEVSSSKTSSALRSGPQHVEDGPRYRVTSCLAFSPP